MDTYIREQITNLRHTLHACPEISGQEKQTKETLQEFLKAHTSLELNDCGEGFYAAHREGAGNGIAFRADYDALALPGRRSRSSLRARWTCIGALPPGAHAGGKDGRQRCISIVPACGGDRVRKRIHAQSLLKKNRLQRSTAHTISQALHLVRSIPERVPLPVDQKV